MASAALAGRIRSGRFALILLSLWLAGCRPAPTTLAGTVTNEAGPVAGAVVAIQATGRYALTDGDGRFTLTGLTPGTPVHLSAWATGAYITGGDPWLPGTDDVNLDLTTHGTTDHAGYEWVSAYAAAGAEGNCENCHAGATGTSLPFDEWQADAHATAAVNPRFLSMYSGRDLAGRQSPPTQFGLNRDYGRIPLLPDPAVPYFGPGYQLDFPDTAGNCAACHAPLAALDAPYDTDPTRLTGVMTEGISCDFCHKVWDVILDPVTGAPFPNRPGVLSYEMRRPAADHQFFAGPFVDVAPGEDTYSPLQRQSQYCAPCHTGVFWGVTVYDSYGEWLASPYSDPVTGQTCQDCHMPPTGADHFALPDAGGLIRDPATIFSHRMPGASDTALLQNAVSLTVDGRQDGAAIEVRVTVINDRTGHYVPTDSPLRHLLLVVTPIDATGRSLPQLNGPQLPDWGGDLAGAPGTIYAKVLQELWTDVAPTAAYWNQTRLLSDNRLAPFADDITVYTFAAPDTGPARVRVRLLYRRAYAALMAQKGWETPDITMAEAEIMIPFAAP